MSLSVHLLRGMGAALLVAGVAVGCSKAVAPPKPVPTVIVPTFAVSQRVNVDARARSTPVVVRLYQLKSTAAFDAADFFSLFERDQQVLGDTLVAREEWVLQPGQTLKLEPRELEGVKSLAVFAAFRDVNRAAWRATVPVVASRTNEIAVRIEGNQVMLSASLAADKAPAK